MPKKKAKESHNDTRFTLAAEWQALIGCVVTAFLVDCSSIHLVHNSDALIPSLVSLQKYEPFFWEQERYGMLLPLIAMPLRSPLVNFLTTLLLSFICALGGTFLLARYLVGRRYFLTVGSLSVAAIMVLTTQKQIVELMATQQFYFTSLAFSLSACLVIDASRSRRALACGFVLMMLACWINWVTPAFLLPLIVLREIFVYGRRVGERRAIVLPQLVVTALAGALGITARNAATYHEMPAKMLPTDRWVETWGKLVTNTIEDYRHFNIQFLWALGAIVTLVACARVVRLRQEASLAARGLAAALLTVSIYALGVGTQQWVVSNQYSARYWLLGSLVVHVSLMGWIISPWLSLLRDSTLHRVNIGAACLMWLCTMGEVGLPSYGTMRAAIDSNFGARTADILANRCTHILGKYWDVWPSVLHTAMVRYERDDDTPVWGITHRSRPTMPAWASYPHKDWVICMPRGDQFAGLFWRSYGLPRVDVVADSGSITVLRLAE